MANPPTQEPHKMLASPVDNMQAMINLVLIASGRYMKTVKQAPAEGPRMQLQLKRAVTAGSERFQDSIDELEKEIRLAQTVLRRDLALLRAERKKKEAAAKEKEAEKARLAAESKNLPLKKEAVAAPPPSTKPASPTPIKAEPADTTRTEPTSQSAAIPAPDPPAPTEDITMENTDNLNAAQEGEFDFDAIFGDSAMDTPGDAANDQSDLNLDPGPDLDFTLDDQPSLLRGLEDFAKDGNDDSAGQNNASNLDLDFNMTDMPEINTSSQQPATTQAQNDTAAQQTTATDDLNLETMTTDNLDDLFNLDDYANPEATQFDDAIFGFGEN